MNARVFNALGLIRKEAGTKGESYLDAWRKQLSKLPLIGRFYDPGVPWGGLTLGFPSIGNKMRYLQNQLDSGSPKWKTEEGKRSQAQFAGSGDGLIPILSDSETRRWKAGKLEEAKKRLEDLSSGDHSKDPYHVPGQQLLPKLIKAAERVSSRQKEYDEIRERDTAEGRKMLSDNGGRWAPKYTTPLGRYIRERVLF